MQEARSELETCRDPPAIADGLTDLLQYPLVRLVHLDVRQKRKIIPLVEPVEMRLEIPANVGVPFAIFISAAEFFSSVKSLIPSAVKMGVSEGSARFSHIRPSVFVSRSC